MADCSEYKVEEAGNDLESILSLKEELTIWFDSLMARIGGTPSQFASPSFKQGYDAEAAIEEQFDELWHNEWHRLNKICLDVVYQGGIPSCAEIRKRMALKKRDRLAAEMRCLRNPPTNPATHNID